MVKLILHEHEWQIYRMWSESMPDRPYPWQNTQKACHNTRVPGPLTALEESLYGLTFCVMLDCDRLLNMKAIFSCTFSGGSTVLSAWSVATRSVSMLVVLMDGWRKNNVWDSKGPQDGEDRHHKDYLTHNRSLTGTSFLKLTPVGLVMVTVLAEVVAVDVVTVLVLTGPGRGALAGAWACAWAWACESAILPGVVIDPCILTGGSRDCWPYSMYWRERKHRLVMQNKEKENRLLDSRRTYLLQMMRELNKVTDGSQVLTVLRIVLQPANHTFSVRDNQNQTLKGQVHLSEH